MFKKLEKIRNFSIIAHVDHGKSTLADEFLRICGAINKNNKTQQILDDLDLERERGVTIKSRAVRLYYKDYILNLIDTPGHVDFHYEVSRSLAACEISILLIDATKGVEAQTIANLEKAMENNHFIIPVLNKIDLPVANIEECLEDLLKLNIDISLVHKISAKTGEGVKELLDFIIEFAPAPKSPLLDLYLKEEENQNLQNTENLMKNEKKELMKIPVRALVVDSWYDKYLGVIIIIRVVDGIIKPSMKLKGLATGKTLQVGSIGIFTPEITEIKFLEAGNVGFIVSQLKKPSEIKIGDTVAEDDIEPLKGFRPSVPVLFCTFFPVDQSHAEETKKALEKYTLNDPAMVFQQDHHEIHGTCFNCGFLGIFHLEIVRERLMREFNISVFTTLPNVAYKVTLKDKKELIITKPYEWPSLEQIEKTEEPECSCSLFSLIEYKGQLMEFLFNRRALDVMSFEESEKLQIQFKIPLMEIITNFSNQLKSLTSGYATYHSQIIGYRNSELVKLIILINDEMVDDFSMIVHKTKARSIGLQLVEKLKLIVPRSQVAIKIQASINTTKNVVARADIGAFRKDVTAKLYGGDPTRRKKLLEKQKKGKEFRAQFFSGIKSIKPENLLILHNLED